uniref:BRCT domain-containing protein n=1 Tax=Kalanchoe fedtschenkoi TaxID=63787 RepID=A0A7N0T8V7_KALFE
MMDGSRMELEPGGSGSRPFDGVRFMLLGFDVGNESEVRMKLISGGGEEIRRNNSDCTHVIVGECVYDDPTCVAARSHGRIVVTGLWVDHSYDIGMPVDHTNVMYRPLKDRNGIPGAKDLVMCLTGYQRQDREDIMIMVSLMGAQFSKPLIANKATHLICYKFEGEKYELAKKIPKIKIVNHTWLEDCLSAWKLLPEDNYAKSGFELEMELEAKDSEEEENPEGSITKQFKGRINVPYGTRVETGGVSKLAASQAMNGVNGTEGSKFLPRDKEVTFAPGEHDNKFDLVIGSRSSADVLKCDPGNQSLEYRDANKDSKPKFPGIVEKSDEPVQSPWKEKRNVLGDSSGSFGSAKKFPESGMNSSNTLRFASKTSQSFSLQMDLSGEARYSDDQLAKGQAFDASASLPKSEQRKESDDAMTCIRTSSLSKEAHDNVLPSKRTQSATHDRVKVPKSSRASTPIAPRRPVVIADNIVLTPTDSGFVAIKRQSPSANKSTPEAQNLLKFDSLNHKGELTDDVTQQTEMTTGVQKETKCTDVSASATIMERSKNESEETTGQKHDIVTSPPRLMPQISNYRHNATLGSGANIKSKLIENLVSGKCSGSRLNFEADSLSSETKNAEDQKNINPPSSENVNLQLKPGRRMGLGKTISGFNLNPEMPSHSQEFGKSKEPDLLVEDCNTPNSKSPGVDRNGDKSVGTRLRMVARAMSESKVPDMLVEKSYKPNSKPLVKNKTGDKSAGTRLKSMAKAASEKCSPTMTKISSMEASNGQENDSTHDAFHKGSSTNKVSSENDGLEMQRVNGSKLIDGFEEPCGPRVDEGRAPEKIDDFETNKSEEVTENRGKQGENNSDENIDPALSFRMVVDNNLDGEEKCSQEKELGRAPLKRGVKRGKRKKGTQGHSRSANNAKTAASLNKLGKNCTDTVTAGNEDLPKVGTMDQQPSNSKAKKHTVKANKLKNVSQNDRPVPDAEDGNMDERILQPPNKNVWKHSAVANQLKNVSDTGKENKSIPDDPENTRFTNEHAVNTAITSEHTPHSGKRKASAIKSYSTNKAASKNMSKSELKCFLLCGHRLQRQELKKIVRKLKGRLCRDSHHWSYQATHLIVPEPPRRTEKFFAAAASGRWILKSDYLTDSLKAGKFLLSFALV